MKESKLFYVNRIGWSALAFGTLALDTVNTIKSHILGFPPLDLGPATNHVGSASGALAAFLGAMVGGLSTFYLPEKWNRRVRIAAPAFLWFLVVGAEENGFFNVATKVDHIAEAIAFLGIAAFVELSVPAARRYLTRTSRPDLRLSTTDAT